MALKDFTSDEYEAVSRIIQRLTAVKIINPEFLTEEQQAIIFDMCGLSKLNDKGNIVSVTISHEPPATAAQIIGNAVTDKLHDIPFTELKDKKVVLTFY